MPALNVEDPVISPENAPVIKRETEEPEETEIDLILLAAEDLMIAIDATTEETIDVMIEEIAMIDEIEKMIEDVTIEEIEIEEVAEIEIEKIETEEEMIKMIEMIEEKEEIKTDPLLLQKTEIHQSLLELMTEITAILPKIHLFKIRERERTRPVKVKMTLNELKAMAHPTILTKMLYFKVIG